MLQRIAVLALVALTLVVRAEGAPSEASPLLAPLSVLKNTTKDTFAGLSQQANANETLPVQPLTVNPNRHIPTTSPVVVPSSTIVTLTPSPNATSSANVTEVVPTPTPKKTKVPSNHTSSSSSSRGDEWDITYPPRRQHYNSQTGSFYNDSSAEGSVNAGDVGYLDPATVVPPPSTEPAPIPQPAGSSVTDADANAQRAKDISGRTGTLFSAAAFVGFAGCAAIAIAAVYTRARPHEDEAPENPFEHTAPVSIELRRTSSGVYNDPLGTRFSSIVMITPNGEGVCIL